MRMLELYKQQMKEIIHQTYKGIDESKIDKILDYVISKKKYEPIVHLRNLYKFIEDFTIPLNELLDVVYDMGLNILANGLLTLNIDDVLAPSSAIMIKWGLQRAEYKAKELESTERGDFVTAKEFQNKQLLVKIMMNSVYGISTMSKSFSSNVDCGGAITAQARNYISEMMWSIEKFLNTNMVFTDISELFSYIRITCKKQFSEEDLAILDYIPTVKDCMHLFKITTRDIDKFRMNSKDMMKSIYIMLNNMDERERIAYYYSNNIYNFIAKNPKIISMFNDFVFGNNLSFDNPYKVPEELQLNISKITHYLKVFVFNVIPTFKRVDKYKTRKRKTVLVSDTDSVMPSLDEFLNKLLLILNREDLKYDPIISVKIVNLCVTFIQLICDEASAVFAKAGNAHEKYSDRLKMKNEFYFRRLIPFINAKKNYVALKVLQEGKVIPEKKQLNITGMAFGSSTLHPEISKRMLNIITERLLKPDDIDLYSIVREINNIKDYIREQINSGDYTFGINKRYNGVEKVMNPERTAEIRASLIWNRLYPDDEIIAGDNIYVFDTSLLTVHDVDRISDKYMDIKNKIKEEVFNIHNVKNKFVGQDFTRFGLKTFAIPADGDADRIPEWLIPFILTDNLIMKHIKPITTLSPSFKIGNNYRKDGQKKYVNSTMINL